MIQAITTNDWKYFQKIQDISKGSHGLVFLAEDTRNKKRYAIK